MKPNWKLVSLCLLLCALVPLGTALADPLTVTTSGPTSVTVRGYNAVGVTWTASASGGVPPYSYLWTRFGTTLSTSATFHATICGDNTDSTEVLSLDVKVTDAYGQTATATHNTTIIRRYVEGGGRGPTCGF